MPQVLPRDHLATLQAAHWVVCVAAGGWFYRLLHDGLRAYRWAGQAVGCGAVGDWFAGAVGLAFSRLLGC